ncbi:dopamine receptor 3 isoform X2 [Microplitis mediator]|uniref:dopamine receptor 3 isoform X2 n=1 Tax=Microplitis mediator TaxID=375433 RepID=UPI00255531C7|nr:dopamine receptor 3 isoform X2 [Microplitis mediator]
MNTNLFEENKITIVLRPQKSQASTALLVVSSCSDLPCSILNSLLINCSFEVMRNATAIFIMNLSISDLMFCCFNLPLATSTFWYGSWTHGPLLCRLFPLLRYGLVAVSLFTVLAITINRYVMIGHPRLYPKLYKPRYLILMVIATWISGFGALVATWFERWGRFGLDPRIGSCSILRDINGKSPKEFLFILAFLTPCIAIVVCYARIFYIVRKTAKKSRRRQEVTTDLVKATIEVKYTKHFEDSALGSSCAGTGTSENTGSPLKNDKLHHSQQINTSFYFISDNDNDNNDIDINDDDEVIDKNDDLNIEKITEYDNKNNSNKKCKKNIYTVSVPNFNFSDVDSSSSPSQNKSSSLSHADIINKEKIVANKSIILNNDRCLKVPRDFIKNCDQFSPRSINPQLLNSNKYDGSDVSEEFVSSRSDSPCDNKRINNSNINNNKRGSIFRRELRFRSFKTRGNESGKMSAKDKKLLKMILVIFLSFVICYLPITITKISKDIVDWRGLNIVGYILIYLTTCINPIIYVVMSSEYRSAYKNVLLCRGDSFYDSKKRGK